MRKIISILLLFVVILTSLVGCRREGNKQPVGNTVTLAPMSPETYARFRHVANESEDEHFENMLLFVDERFASLPDFGIICFDKNEMAETFNGTWRNTFATYTVYCDYETCVGSDVTYYQKIILELPMFDEMMPDAFCDLIINDLESLANTDVEELTLSDFERNVSVLAYNDHSMVELNATFKNGVIEMKFDLTGYYDETVDYQAYIDGVATKLLSCFIMYRSSVTEG